MKKIKIIVILVITFGAFFGCEDVLDTTPGDSYSSADIYSDVALAERLVYFSYNATESWGMNFNDWWTRRMNLENASDESYFHFQPWIYRTNHGTTTTAQNRNGAGVFNSIYRRDYVFINHANSFLKAMETAPILTSHPDESNGLIGEMRYLRAYSYARLVNYHGGVVLLDEPFDLEDNTLKSRSSYQECIDFIVADLDAAIAMIPAGKRDGALFGRASRAAAMALKSRILLYAASPLHDASTMPQPAEFADLYTYPGSSNEKWLAASDAAWDLIQLGGYALEPVSSAAEYQQLHVRPNSELIFARPYSPAFANVPGDFNTLPDKANGTVSSGGWGLSNPTHNVVQAFKMANGMRIGDAGSGYTDDGATSIYDGREMRFYANIVYQGSTYRGFEPEYWLPGGLDSQDVNVAPDHFADTGYNLRKFMDESIEEIGVTQAAQRPYPLARLAEIYLNYAEAQFMLGNEGIARTYANMTANRVGLNITSSGPTLLEDIKYERQMELFFEGHRYFDTRRWVDEANIAPDVLGVQWRKVDGGGMLDANGTLVRDDRDGVSFPIIEDRELFTRSYYLPIPQEDLDKASLTQNFDY